MAAQPQPIYPNELNTALERWGARIAGILDARLDSLTMQMHADKLQITESINTLAQEALQRDLDLAKIIQQHNQESIMRDTNLLKRIEVIENTQARHTTLLEAIARTLGIQDV